MILNCAFFLDTFERWMQDFWFALWFVCSLVYLFNKKTQVFPFFFSLIFGFVLITMSIHCLLARS